MTASILGLVLLLLIVPGISDAQRVTPPDPITSMTCGGIMSCSTSAGVVTATGSIVAGSASLSTQTTAGVTTIDLGATIAPTSFSIGSGTTVTGLKVYHPSLTPAQIGVAIGAVQQTFAVSGLSTADAISVNPPGQTALCPMVAARVSADDTLALTFANLVLALCTPASGTYTILAVRS